MSVTKHRVVSISPGRSMQRICNIVNVACTGNGVDPATTQEIITDVLKQMAESGLVVSRQVSA
jgi:hypothetical protein